MQIFKKIIPFKALRGMKARKERNLRLQDRADLLERIARCAADSEAAVFICIDAKGAVTVQYLASSTTYVLGLMDLGRDVMLRHALGGGIPRVTG